MKHFPARTGPVRIATEADAARAADDIIRATRRMFWLSVAQTILCGLIGVGVGALYAFGWWFEATGGWAR